MSAPTPNQPAEVIRNIYTMVSGDRGIHCGMLSVDQSIALEVLLTEIQAMIETEMAYLFDEEGNLR